jgi:ATPase subunit of ABC transporter with duplicated ATPase domains
MQITRPVLKRFGASSLTLLTGSKSALAKCGLTTQHIESKIVVLSGGEQAKVRLCKLINKETISVFWTNQQTT